MMSRDEIQRPVLLVTTNVKTSKIAKYRAFLNVLFNRAEQRMVVPWPGRASF